MDSVRGAHTTAGGSNWSRGLSPQPPHFSHWSQAAICEQSEQYFLVRELGLSKGVVSLCLEVAEISRGDRNKR